MVEALVGPFYERVLADPELKPFFTHTPMDKLRCMQAEFFTAALDGPVHYGGMDLTHAHWGKGIRPHHVQRFMDHLLETLKACNIQPTDVDEIIRRLSIYADDITATGGEDG